MKKISKLISLTALSLLAVTSCDLFTIGEEYDNYVPAEKPAVAEVYFAQGLPASYDLKGKSSFSVPVNRVSTTAALTVDLVSVAEPIFTVPSTVSFAAGEAVTNIVVTYNEADLLPGGEYSFTFTLPEETSVYGDNSFSCKGSLPASFQKWKKGHLTLGYYAQEEDQDVYYQEVNPNLWYCYIEDCFDTEKHDDFPETAKPTKYYFYWDKETNFLQIPMQAVDGAVDSDGCQLYFGDGEAFYKEVYKDNPDIFVSVGYKDAADYAYNVAGLARPMYDENGGFYLANCYFLSYEQSVDMFGESGYAWSVGDLQDLLVIEGFNRTTDYNNGFDYEGLWSAEVKSEAFDAEWSDQIVRICYDKVVDKEDEAKVVYYLQDYFSEGYGLPFIAHSPEELDPTAEEEVVYELDNALETGLKVFGQTVAAEVKGGKVIFDEDEDYPSFEIKVNVYTIDEDGKKLTNFGTFTESINPYDEYADWYSADDLYGLYKEDYFGYLQFYGTDPDDGETYHWSINISDAEDEDDCTWVMFDGLVPIKPEYMPVNKVKIEWYDGYLYLQKKVMEGPFVYGGESFPTSIYPMNTETGRYYEDSYLLGGYVYDEEEDVDLLVFVDYPYNDNPVNGFYATADGFGGLMYYCNLWGYWEGAPSSVKSARADSKAWSIRQTKPAFSKNEGKLDFSNVKLSFAASDRMIKKTASKKTAARTLNTSNAKPAQGGTTSLFKAVKELR